LGLPSRHGFEQEVRTALVAVIDPEIRRSVVELDMARAVAIEGSGEVTIALTVPAA
jgi:metal-sulfur cluster biosynthetic enzyme